MSEYDEIYKIIKRIHAPLNDGIVMSSLIKKLWEVNEKELLNYFIKKILFIKNYADETYIIFPSISKKIFDDIKIEKNILVIEKNN